MCSEVDKLAWEHLFSVQSAGHQGMIHIMDSVVEVTKVEARCLDVPLLAPFEIASTKLSFVNNVAIRLELVDGSVGWGEAPTLPPVTSEDQPTALAKALEVSSELVGYSARCYDILGKIFSLLPSPNFAAVRAGIDMALLDAVARRVGLPLWQLFGGQSSCIRTDITIPICTPAEAARLAAEYARRGFQTIKTKIGGRTVFEDIEMLKAIRHGHPNCSLILDANGGYTVQQALQVLEDLNNMGLKPALFEQPVARDDWAGLGLVCKVAMDEYKVLVAADESCRGPADAERIVNEGLANVINIKLAKVGVLGALQIVSISRKAGIDLMMGGMVETRIAMGFAGHFAAGLGGFRFLDLDTPILLATDPVLGGYQVDGCMYNLGGHSGHGGSLPWPE